MILRYLSILMGLFLLGCGSEKEPSESNSSKPVETIKFEVEKGGEPDPIANTSAVKGGTINTWGGAFPKSLNMFLDYNSSSKAITELMFEPLVELHSTKDKPVGILAESWTESDDGMTFTFKIHPKARWSDGKKITSADVKFYYDTMMNPKNLTSLFRVSLSKIESPKIIDDLTLEVKAKSKHWMNFWIAGELFALPKHSLEKVDFNTVNFKFDVVSGPYKIGELSKGRSIVLHRRKDWWGNVKQYNQNKYNFDKIRYRSIEDRLKALELFKKGDLDFFPIYTAKIWAKQTDFDAIKNNWVVRQEIRNQEPKSFSGIAFNMRRDIFKDVRVRKAMAYLLDRDLMNEKFMYNQYFMLNSYYPDLHPGNLNPKVERIKYNQEKARALFKEAGWKVNEQGRLEKDGKLFDITLNTFSSDSRHMGLYKEHLKEVGVEMTMEMMSFSTYMKRKDNHDFDIIWMSWAASRLRDPESMWHSKQAMEIATQNITAVQDEKIDALIEQQKTEMDLNKRNEIARQIDQRLAEINPYALLWQSDAHRLLYWNKFGTPKSVLDKFNDHEEAVVYWYVDPSRETSLKEAKSKKASLPAEPKEVSYSE